MSSSERGHVHRDLHVARIQQDAGLGAAVREFLAGSGVAVAKVLGGEQLKPVLVTMRNGELADRACTKTVLEANGELSLRKEKLMRDAFAALERRVRQKSFGDAFLADISLELVCQDGQPMVLGIGENGAHLMTRDRKTFTDMYYLTGLLTGGVRGKRKAA